MPTLPSMKKQGQLLYAEVKWELEWEKEWEQLTDIEKEDWSFIAMRFVSHLMTTEYILKVNRE